MSNASKKNKKYATHSRHSMTRQLNNDNGLQARWTERQHLTAPTKNWRFSASYDSFVVQQTFVLRMNICGKNRQLLVAAKRYLQATQTKEMRHTNKNKLKTTKYFLLTLFILSFKFGHSQNLVDTLIVSPNPFNKSTTICLDIANNDTITLSIYDMLGRNVRTYYNNTILHSGTYSIEFLRDTLHDGMYFVNLQFGTRKKKIIKVAVLSSSTGTNKLIARNDKNSYPNSSPKKLVTQILKYIPDNNLRNELCLQGFTTNDSLDIKKVEGRLQLELNEKGIENLDGLQYFKQVWRLVLDNNKIKNLNHLPPNVAGLDCSNNEISRIDSLPEHLDYLGCANNKINFIDNLPNSLTQFVFANNKMTYFPTLPQNIKWVNYSNNPIPFDSLPNSYKQMTCDNIGQNCLPYEFISWKILNINTKDTTFKILGLRINVDFDLKETIDFKFIKSKMVLSRTIRTRGIQKPDTIYYNKSAHSFETNKLKNILNDIILSKLIIKIQIADSLKTINLNNIKNGLSPCVTSCDDCSYGGLGFEIYTEKETIKFGYGFMSDLGYGIDLCTYDLQDIRILLDYLYILKLIYLTIPDHYVTKFPEVKIRENVDKIYRWTKK